MSRRRWHDWHRWIGLKLSILMSFILLTGTVATISHEIDWLFDSRLRAFAPESESGALKKASWGQQIEAIQSAYPHWTIFSFAAPVNPGFASEAVVFTETGERRRVRVNPYTARITGEGPWINAQRIFRDSHRRLFIFQWWGIALVSVFSILLMASIVTGLITYRKFWRGFFKAPRTKNARTLWGDLHRLGGLWQIWFGVVIALTGFYYLVEVLGLRAPPLPADPPTVQDLTTSVPAWNAHLDANTIDALIARARTALPDLRVRMIHPPAAAGEPFRVSGQTSAVLVRDRANEVQLDPATGAVLSVRHGSMLTVHQRIGEAADPLHFGTFGTDLGSYGGLIGKLVYFVFGVILTALSFSGVYVFSSRIRRGHGASADLKSRPAYWKRPYWREMGFWKWPALLGLIYCLGFLPLYILYGSGGQIWTGRIQPAAAPSCAGPLGWQKGDDGTIHLFPRVHATCGRHIQSAILSVTASGTLLHQASLSGAPYRWRISLPKDAAENGTRTTLDIVLSDGERQSIGWPLAF